MTIILQFPSRGSFPPQIETAASNSAERCTL